MSMPPITDGWGFLSWLYAVAKDPEEIAAVKVYIDGLQAEITVAERGRQEAVVGGEGLRTSLYALEERVLELTRERDEAQADAKRAVEIGERAAQLTQKAIHERDEARRIAFNRHHAAKKYHARMWGEEAAEQVYGPEEEKHEWLRGYKP